MRGVQEGVEIALAILCLAAGMLCSFLFLMADLSPFVPWFSTVLIGATMGFTLGTSFFLIFYPFVEIVFRFVERKKEKHDE